MIMDFQTFRPFRQSRAMGRLLPERITRTQTTAIHVKSGRLSGFLLLIRWGGRIFGL